jgi:predicted dehydrogenase
MKIYNWGILGAGKIARLFAEDLGLLPNARLHAVSSRSGERAADFAAEYNIPVHYGNWEGMAADPDVDIVYVATHHPFHFENTLACLEAGKAVLCEKPFTMNRRELEILVRTAKEKGVFLMEAIWTRFLPSTSKVLEIIDKGSLGGLQNIYADFGFRVEFDPEHRLYSPAKGGGALLDIGIYPVFISLLVAGLPERILAVAGFEKNGVDHGCNMIFEQPNHVVSSLNCTFRADSPTEAHLLFEKGRITMESLWLTPGPITLYRKGSKPERTEFPESGNGYQYEAEETMRCLDVGLMESPLLPLDFSLDLMGTLDRIREICGIKYEQDIN